MMKPLPWLLILPALWLGGGCESSPEPSNTADEAGDGAAAETGEAGEDPFEVARRLHLAGVDGDADAARRAHDRFADLYEQHPDSPLIRAYLGSAKLLLSRDAAMPWNKQSHAEAGGEHLNAAVEAAPDDVAVRLVRAASTIELPGFFDVADQTRADIHWLAKQYEQRGDTLDDRTRAHIAYLMGRQQHIDGNTEAARQWLQRAVQHAPDTRPARAAEAVLTELSG